MKLNFIKLVLLSSLVNVKAEIPETNFQSEVNVKADPYLENLIYNLNQIKKDFSDIPVKSSRLSLVTKLGASNEATSKKYARLAGASYCADANISNWSCGHCKVYGGFKVTKVFSDSKYDTKGYVGVDTSNKIVVLSFRGSSNLKNWIQNIKIDKTNLFPGNNNIQVHLGFKQARDALSPVYTPAVSALLKSNPTFKLVIAGHSLGGAIGTLAAIDLQASQKLSWSNIQLFTYGQPRVGNSNFATWFNSLSLMSTRTTNNKDIVPHVPPRSMSFNHHHVELWLNGGKAKVCSTSSIEDTSCALSAEPFLSVDDHLTYWDVRLGGTC